MSTLFYVCKKIRIYLIPLTSLKFQFMKRIAVSILIIFSFLFVNAQESILGEIPNGTWIPVRQEIGGKPIPAASFNNQKLVILDSSYTVVAESVDKGTVSYKNDKMDIYSKQGVNAGKHFTALYKIEKDKLTICYDLSGKHYPESFETKDNPNYFISVYTKQK